MKWLRISFVALATALLAVAQTASDLESPAVNRVGARLLCSCGCKTNLNCRMEPYPCGVCRQAKVRIFKMQQAGMSDQAIIDAFVKENGPDVLAVPPGRIGTMLSYSALVVGLLLIYWFIRRYRKPAVTGVSAQDDENLARYRDQIEKDIAKLE